MQFALAVSIAERCRIPYPLALARARTFPAAPGLTDKEVAAQLFLYGRTVDTHMRHIFGKVDVGNRTALGTWVAEQGLHRYLDE